MMRISDRSAIAGILVVSAATWASGASGMDAADKCVAKKMKLAGKYVFCRMKAESKAVKKGTPPDFAKCDSKFAAKWAAIEAKAAGACPTEGDATAVGDIAIADAGLMAGTVAAVDRFQDNGNGSITDVNTGLTWEKKSYLDDSIHDIAETYDWDEAFSVHIATLNGTTFAGHSDWRVPTPNEMLTLINFRNPADVRSFPAFDVNCTDGCDISTCSCAFAQVWNGDNFWTSITNPEDPTEAITVTNDYIQIEFESHKTSHYPVIAVRGGRRND